MAAAYTIELQRLDTPRDNDAGLLSAIAQDQAETRAWREATCPEQRHALLRHWNQTHILSLRVSIAACPPKTPAEVVARQVGVICPRRSGPPDIMVLPPT